MDEDDEEDEVPAPVAMPTAEVNMQPGDALVDATTVTSPIGRALSRVQRLLIEVEAQILPAGSIGLRGTFALRVFWVLFGLVDR